MSREIIEAVRTIEQEKGIDGDTLIHALEDALLAAYKKTPGAARHATVELDEEGEFRVFSIEIPGDLEARLLEEAMEAKIDELERLGEEIGDGLVEIRGVAREPGYRSKIAVESHVQGVDPVGACVGPRGSRVRMVVSELRGEKIDIIPWNDEPARFVAKALSPARVREVLVDDEGRQATVIVPDDQLSLAIGREGHQALAGREGDEVAPAAETEAPAEEAPAEAAPAAEEVSAAGAASAGA